MAHVNSQLPARLSMCQVVAPLSNFNRGLGNMQKLPNWGIVRNLAPTMRGSS